MADQRGRKPARQRGSGGRDKPPAQLRTTAKGQTGSTFILKGSVEPDPGDSALAVRVPADGGKGAIEISVKAAFRPASRAAGPVQPVKVADKDVLEIEFADGQRVWMSGEEYRRHYAGTPSRDETGSDVFHLSEGLQVLPNGMQSRGPVSWTIKALKVLGVDLHGMTAKQVARIVENRKGLRRKGLILYRCQMEPERFDLAKADLLTQTGGHDSPLLIFIHGTASSTWGSFGELWSRERATELTALRRAYGERVFAFEHETLAVSPIENALALVRQIPAGATLHLVTHSRGGLVGELICRAGSGRRINHKVSGKGSKGTENALQPFEEDEFRLFEGIEAYTSKPEPEDLYDKETGRKSILESLKDLDQELRKKRIRVERFVRVACPALGTTLASERLDRWLSVVGSVAGKALPGTPMADFLGDIGEFIAAVVQEHTDPKTLPGLEAMMPDSSLIKLLNWPRATVPGDLFVIAGDIEPDAWWAKLLVWATDRFYEGDHDLVVNTPSMYGGTRREGHALVSFHKGSSVNHFTYFRNTESARSVVNALTQPVDKLGFEELIRPTVDIARAVAAARAVGPRPVVFLLPGIMGSELSISGDRVWLDIPDVIFGGMRKISIDAKGVRATELFSRYYGELAEFLSSTHRVVPFPYDWRLTVEREADRLAEAVRNELEQARLSRQPVRIMAHSMGGLVARTMIARHQDLWREISAHAGSRLVMLGTPTNGSHAITELLVGRSGTLRKLAFLDLRHDQQKMLGIISQYPGVLSMLPKDNRENYFSFQTWKTYHDRAGGGWVLPEKEDLEKVSAFRQLLDNAPLEADRMVYVAGCSDVTVCNMYFDEKDEEEHIKFEATTRGDGRVTWDSGIPPGIPVWYMDVEHGDLPACEEAFPALLDLLQSGTTALLPHAPPLARAAADTFPMPRDADVIYPNEEGLQAAVLGSGPRRRRRMKRREPMIRVRVIHGNLAFARYPVAVGHYAGDTIISAEKALDHALGGQLSRRHQLGLYPGAVGTSAVFVNPRLRNNRRATPKGAVVVGLGTAGSLSETALSRTFAHGLLEYVVMWSDQKLLLPEGEAETGLGMSALLIGTGAGGVGVADSVFSLLQGVVEANDTLAASKQPHRITEIEFIELWEDRAIQAVKAFSRLEQDPELRGRFALATDLRAVKGGRKRPSYEEPEGWWHRLQILGGTQEAGSTQQILRFTSTTKRARNEVRLQPTQRALVDRFVEQAIRTTQNDRTISRTLLELLVPNELKDAAPDTDDMVLLLDKESAGYPWELLDDPSIALNKAERRPFVLKHGVLRQLEIMDFRETVRPGVSNNALVVGDPLSPFVELKGAQAEARAVARSLDADGKFSVTMLDRPEGEDVIHSLYERPYRILHLAGHGVYHYLPQGADNCEECGQPLPPQGETSRERRRNPVTGMVIGDNMFLTPVEVRQMRQVPELVFINCCHLGRIEGNENEKNVNARRDYNLIAASVATEFIGMGVRAVIAAGWAVDDGAASTFARTFYDLMLKGEKFGRAVKFSRKETYDRHPWVNTWGAYQCYGDPDYVLVRDRRLIEDKKEELNFATPSVVITEIENLTAQLSTMSGRDISWQTDELRRIIAWLEKKTWINNGKICIALAHAFGEALMFGESVDFYQRALDMDPSATTLKDVEQLANLISRAAVDTWKRGDWGKGHDPLAEIKRAIGYLTWLVTPPTGSKTSERLSLFGSAYKRKAWIAADKKTTVDAVVKMREYYAKACEVNKGKDPYPILNYLFSVLVEGWVGRGHRIKREAIFTQLGSVGADLDARLAGDPDFWAEASRIDCDLLKSLAANSLDITSLDDFTLRYQEIRQFASRREFGSVLDQIEFLVVMATAAGKTNPGRTLRDLLDRLNPEQIS